MSNRYIDADAFMQHVTDDNEGYLLSDRLSVMDIENYVDETPTVDVEPVVHAHWIVDDKEGHKIWHCHCSNCKKDPQDCIVGTDDWWMVRLPYFCPNCGAKMIKGGAKR